MLRIYRHIISLRWGTIRPLSSAPKLQRGRNVLERYTAIRQPQPMLPQAISDIAADDRKDAFETTATAPVGMSFQETPSPGSTVGSKLAVKLPAMVAPEASEPIKKPKQVEIKVEGVVIPPKPTPPGEEECCMSGCVHCVYTIYADDLEAYTTALSDARSALIKANKPRSAWPDVIRDMEEEGKSAGQIDKEEKEKVVQGVDPSMAAFLALENKIKKRQVGS